MRYDEFRDDLHLALRGPGLFIVHRDRVIETVDLASLERRWKLLVRQSAPRRAEPFHVSSTIGFRWSPFDAARSYSCEEDLLSELLGRKRRSAKTKPRLVRVDLTLRANLPHGSTTPLPEPGLVGPWATSAEGRLDALPLTETRERAGRTVAVMGFRQDVEVQARMTPEGMACLRGVSLSAFRMVQIPRVRDDPDHQAAEKGPGPQLQRLARLFKAALEEWTAAVTELATWIRYSPPPGGGAAGIEEPEDEEPDDGPETAH